MTVLDDYFLRAQVDHRISCSVLDDLLNGKCDCGKQGLAEAARAELDSLRKRLLAAEALAQVAGLALTDMELCDVGGSNFGEDEYHSDDVAVLRNALVAFRATEQP